MVVVWYLGIPLSKSGKTVTRNSLINYYTILLKIRYRGIVTCQLG